MQDVESSPDADHRPLRADRVDRPRGPGAVTRIDTPAHVIPDEYRRALPRLPDGSPLPLPPAPLEGLGAMMGRYGIGGAGGSTGPPGAVARDRAQAVELARLANELVAGIVRGDPS